MQEENKGTEDHTKFIEALGGDFAHGKVLEIIDGEMEQIEESSFGEILNWIQVLNKNNSSLLVLTILGPELSDKTTLLRYLAGAKFQVSRARRTKGLNAILLQTEFENNREILILKAEGMFSKKLYDPKYDNKLAIFCMAVSNVLLFNIKDEIALEFKWVENIL